MFKYRKISEEKCKQLNQIDFCDPEQGGAVDFLKNNVAVISDECRRGSITVNNKSLKKNVMKDKKKARKIVWDLSVKGFAL